MRSQERGEFRKEARKAEAGKEARKIEAERETRKMELEMELKKIELTARTQDEDGESGDLESAGATAAPRDHSLTGRTKRFGDALRHVLPRMPSEHAELPQVVGNVVNWLTF